ncbi:SMI1/KNR4 family protein [Pseudomonas sp. CFBP 13711]|nr:SMI1/KNR4 family protein [Pseudomonas sp. CFBP 13711]MBD8713752.1 SMI1/KNR4 family protein [Pseudomonas sp. CFBP 13715]
MELENLVKGSLPQVFKKIYLHNNGGFPSKTEFDGDDFCFSIGGFNPIRYGNPSIESLIKDLNRGDGVMQSLVPFAYDDNGNTFMLSLRDEDYGKVYLWLQDEERMESVISSFDNFVAALK